MLLYQSGGDYYALCDRACLSFLREWLANPDARIKPTKRIRFEDGGEYVAYACSFCAMPIDPETWGEPIEQQASVNHCLAHEECDMEPCIYEEVGGEG